MRVLLAGASGAIGTRLVSQLVDRGHEVIGTSRSPDRAERLHALGAEPMVLDLLDPRAVRTAVFDTKPDAIIHQATALAGLSDFKHFDRSFAQTNRLRIVGTDALLAAAQQARVGRLVAQSFANHRYARQGGPVKAEQNPLDPSPAPTMRESEAAMAYLDQAVTDAGGIALRYGNFYGDPDDGLVQAVRSRSFRSSATAAASGRSSTSTTPPRPPCSRSNTVEAASTTSSTTSPPPCASGCRCSRRRSAPSRPDAFPAGWRGCSPAKPRS
jgi:2-alkyl-3-oxoalkanoate reductase